MNEQYQWSIFLMHAFKNLTKAGLKEDMTLQEFMQSPEMKKNQDPINKLDELTKFDQVQINLNTIFEFGPDGRKVDFIKVRNFFNEHLLYFLSYPFQDRPYNLTFKPSNIH
jgi:hypothetical protein